MYNSNKYYSKGGEFAYNFLSNTFRKGENISLLFCGGFFVSGLALLVFENELGLNLFLGSAVSSVAGGICHAGSDIVENARRYSS
jgi:hypothetical protein